jgi:putative SOS response-associated peptidase YedK
MCGRFTQAYTWRELVALYRLTQPAMNLQSRYNIAPTATIDVLIPRNSDQLELWQLVAIIRSPHRRGRALMVEL